MTFLWSGKPQLGASPRGLRPRLGSLFFYLHTKGMAGPYIHYPCVISSSLVLLLSNPSSLQPHYNNSFYQAFPVWLICSLCLLIGPWLKREREPKWLLAYHQTSFVFDFIICSYKCERKNWILYEYDLVPLHYSSLFHPHFNLFTPLLKIYRATSLPSTH